MIKIGRQLGQWKALRGAGPRKPLVNTVKGRGQREAGSLVEAESLNLQLRLAGKAANRKLGEGRYLEGHWLGTARGGATHKGRLTGGGGLFRG